MWLLSQKDGKPWWAKQTDTGEWVLVSEEENDAWKTEMRDMKDRIAAKIFNDFFSTKEQV